MADRMTEVLVLPVLRQAIRKRQPKSSLIHQTDRGGRYEGTRYLAVLRRTEIIQSMSSVNNCTTTHSRKAVLRPVKIEWLGCVM